MTDGNHTAAGMREESPESGKAILDAILTQGFDGDIHRLGIVLGRPNEELNQFLTGEQVVDEDLIMKMRGIADQRGIDIL
ncbi:MAG: hypothetical protein ACR2IH_03405 [Pyrinomonadaceae bacterium]